MVGQDAVKEGVVTPLGPLQAPTSTAHSVSPSEASPDEARVQPGGWNEWELGWAYEWLVL